MPNGRSIVLERRQGGAAAEGFWFESQRLLEIEKGDRTIVD